MLVPAALEQWAAEHSEQLSGETATEVEHIAAAIRTSPVAQTAIGDVDDAFSAEIDALFEPARAKRANALVAVVAKWARSRPETPRAKPSARPTAESQTEAGVDTSVPAVSHPAPPISALPDPDLHAGQVNAPAFLASDRVDEEDDLRLYGPKRPWRAIVGAVVGLAAVTALVLGGLYFFNNRTTTDTETATPTEVPVAEQSAVPVEAPTEAPVVEPTPEPTPTAEPPSFWADTTPILNSGTAEIMASTYAVSPANRAVLTGHTAAITGVVVTEDGRVLTSGADRRLVDWGADVTLANPEVLNVPSPLTVLEQTSDQRLLVGDASGSLSLLDTAGAAEPLVRTVHPVAISAIAQLPDGQLAVASVDGDVAVYPIDDPDSEITLEHGIEVTAVEALADGTIVTAAVDGVVRLWPAGGTQEPQQIATLDAPVTALTVLSDGRLATASVQGDIHLVQPDAALPQVAVLPGHVGAVRSLFELDLDGTLVLASGGDDTTVRIWDIAELTELRVLEGHGDIISGINRLPDGRLVTTSGDGTGRVWDLELPANRPVLPSHDWNLSAAHPWDNDQFVTGGVDGKVILSSTVETSEPVVLARHEAPVVGVARLGNGAIASLDTASVLQVTDSTATPLGSPIELGPGAITFDVLDTLAIEPPEDTDTAADDTVNASEEDSDEQVDGEEGEGADAELAVVEVIPVGDTGSAGVVSGHSDGAIRFHNFDQEVLVIDVHGSGVNDVVALSTGLVASAGEDNTVRIVDPETPDTIPVFDLHTGPVDVVVELPDGRIASAGRDAIYVYSVDELGQDALRLNGQRARTLSLIGLPGDRLISTGEDGRVRLWDLNNPDAEPETLIDIPGVINPHLIQADNGLFVAGAARGYVVFTLS